MKNLYIDFDGVILDSITTLTNLLNEAGIDINNREDVVNFYKNLDWEQAIKDTPILNDSIHCINKIKESNHFYISILTHVNSIDEIVAKVNFIRKYFVDIPVIACPKQLSKSEIVLAKDAILIDDWHVNLEEWKQAGGIGIHFSTSMKNKGFRCIDHIDDVLKMDF